VLTLCLPPCAPPSPPLLSHPLVCYLSQYLDISSSTYGRELSGAAPMLPGLLLSLGALPRLQRLDVSRRALSEAQLRQLLSSCKSLQELRILGAPLTWQQVSEEGPGKGGHGAAGEQEGPGKGGHGSRCTGEGKQGEGGAYLPLVHALVTRYGASYLSAAPGAQHPNTWTVVALTQLAACWCVCLPAGGGCGEAVPFSEHPV
jgi:hypothetical protein